jgi:hypothetical protein
MIHSLKLILILLTINSISTYNRELNDYSAKERSTISAITEYCSVKPKEDFCSADNLKYMLRALQQQREVYMKRMEYNKKMRNKILMEKLKQIKLRKFFDKHPKFKIMAEYSTPRYFFN